MSHTMSFQQQQEDSVVSVFIRSLYDDDGPSVLSDNRFKKDTMKYKNVTFYKRFTFKACEKIHLTSN